MIRQVLSRISDVLYWALAVLWAGGAFASVAFWLNKISNESLGPSERPAAIIALLLAVFLTSWVIELLFPLRAMSEPQWIYKYRPMKTLRTFDSGSWIQFALFALLGLLLGSSVGEPIFGSIITAGLRLLLSFRVKPSLPALLRAGRTRLITSAVWSVPNSELISDMLAATWIGRKPRNAYPPTFSIWKLFFRRAFRRSYLFAIGTTQLLLIVVLSRFWSGFVMLFLLSWGLLGAGFYRCADFRRIGIETWLPNLVLFVHSFVPVLMIIFLWDPAHLFFSCVTAFLAVFLIGYQRAQPRIRDSLYEQDFDTGIGIVIPQDVLTYHLVGLRSGIFFGFLTWWFL
ncbi:MAG: hypothetical protein Q4A92_03075 [Corynebacterium sp.]|nr:hypothetical protein [Corynebacterium sp.]